ncbi:MAG: L,D-transpeptidase family protein [Rhodobacteraceae bacterium]|nr:L,D-transpeptidase family protein [Paracoccaceae bacterium]
MRPALRWILLAALTAAAGVVALVLHDRFGPRPSVPGLAPAAERADLLVIEKSARLLTAFRNGDELLRVDIALGFAPQGDKRQEGDGKTPEGHFRIDRRNPASAYHLSLGLDYPHPADIARARAEGSDPGGDIFIHGQPNGAGRLTTLPWDWTAGCIAVSNAEIEALWRIAPTGTQVEIRP